MSYEEPKPYKKNPYDLRYDVLSMAKDMLDRSYETNKEIAKHAMHVGGVEHKDILSAYYKYIPKMYTPEEVKNQAQMLYEFIQKKD